MAIPNGELRWGAHLPYMGLELVGKPQSLWHMASALPSQSQRVTAIWPVPNYTAWWQRHTGV